LKHGSRGSVLAYHVKALGSISSTGGKKVLHVMSYFASPALTSFLTTHLFHHSLVTQNSLLFLECIKTCSHHRAFAMTIPSACKALSPQKPIPNSILFSQKLTQGLEAWLMWKMEFLSSKHKALSSNPSYWRKKKKKEEETKSIQNWPGGIHL
jgi:hypothetical protein